MNIKVAESLISIVFLAKSLKIFVSCDIRLSQHQKKIRQIILKWVVIVNDSDVYKKTTCQLLKSKVVRKERRVMGNSIFL